MKNKSKVGAIILFIVIILAIVLLWSSFSNVEILWEKTYGGEKNEDGWFVLSNDNEGCLIAGYTESYGFGSKDIWVLKIDENGDEIWNHTYGGSKWDTAKAILKSDNNYLIIGSTASYGMGNSDIWLIKIDENGTEIWNKTYGMDGWDEGASIIQAEDGGYVIVGSTSSFGAGSDDLWAIKIDSFGIEQWNFAFGGENEDIGRSIDIAQDGYIIGGITSSYGAGGDDMWLIKINSKGVEQWNKTFGTVNNERCNQVTSATNGDILLVGHAILEGNNRWNAFVVNTNSNGEIQWGKTFEEDVETGLSSCTETSDGYVIVGHKGRYGKQQDLMLLNIDFSGNIISEFIYEREFGNAGVWINKDEKSQFYITGYSDNNGNGFYDLWLLKIKI
jgi:predicted secreted protein